MAEELLKQNEPLLEEESGTFLSDWRWFGENGLRIMRYKSGPLVAGTNTIYEVPVGKILYLISATLAVTGGIDINSEGTGYIAIDGPSEKKLLIAGTTGVGGQVSTSLSPAIPIKINAGEKVTITHAGNMDGLNEAAITGFTVDK